jgi:hypothetical protein
MMAIGIVLTSAGGIGTVAGIFGILATNSNSAFSSSGGPFVGSLVAGLCGLALGIPLTVVGNRKVTRAERDRALLPEPSVSLRAGLGSVGIGGAW